MSNNTKAAPSTAKASSNATATQSNKTESKQVTASPYTVTACDQIVEVSAKTLLDENDFTKKGDSFFTMSVYMINQFEKRDGNTLKQSVSFDKINIAPSIIQGSVSCIRFSDSSYKSFVMCLPDKTSAEGVLKAFNQYKKCRMGDNLKNTPEETVKKLLQASCLGLNVNLDIKKFGGDANKAKAAYSTAMNNALKNVGNKLKDLVKPKEDKVNNPIA